MNFILNKISSVATGDFHTLIISEIITKDQSEINENAGNGDILAFGYNLYGQVDGIPSDHPILNPKIVHFFIGKRPKLVSASRSRSVAITEDGKVYEWGYLGEFKKQFNLLYDFSSESEQKDEEITDIHCGPEFTIFQSKTGKAWIIGMISQVGDILLETETLVSLNELILKSLK